MALIWFRRRLGGLQLISITVLVMLVFAAAGGALGQPLKDVGLVRALAGALCLIFWAILSVSTAAQLAANGKPRRLESLVTLLVWGAAYLLLRGLLPGDFYELRSQWDLVVILGFGIPVVVNVFDLLLPPWGYIWTAVNAVLQWIEAGVAETQKLERQIADDMNAREPGSGDDWLQRWHNASLMLD